MSDLECPQCGISESERKPSARIKALGMSMFYCPICLNIWREPEAHTTEERSLMP
jgi:predicted RNA-binding Zn-ribbon protein involved in translation (DUF1610 family)